MVSWLFVRRPGRARIALQLGVVAVTTVGLVGFTAVSAQAALPTGPTTTGLTGSRPSATNLTFPISDRVSAQVDVATGNLLVSTAGLALTGVNSPVQIGATYNSLGFETGNTTTPAANGWATNLDGAGTLTISGTTPIYVGPDGSTWKFTPVSGSTTAYTAPAGLAKSLTHDTTANTYTLTDLKSRTVVVYDSNGNPTSITDKNGNAVTPTFTSGVPTSLATTAGPAAARTATFSYNASTFLWTISQTNGTHSRSISYQKDSSSNITSFKDAEGKSTAFTYTSGHLTKIVSTTGAETDFTYTTAGKISEVDQHNTTAGSPGTSTTRLSYPSTAQTLVAGPDTDPSVAVATGPHTTYAVNPSQELVLQATDAMGRVRSATYNANSLPLTNTSGAAGATGTTTTTGVYGANSNQSLTSVTSQGGTSSTATYSTANPATAFLPQSTTSDTGSGSSTTMLSYDPAGNQNSTSTGSGATLATSTLTHNSDGTVATALAPGNGTNTTDYTYNSDHQLTSMDPPTGTSLLSKEYTYDYFGRLKTETDGAFHTTTYTYDNDDRVLTTEFSDGTHDVTNTFDAAGHLTDQSSGGGDITNTYDQLGNLTSTYNSYPDETVSYTYDKASNEASMTTSYGTWTNTFDASGVLLVTKYPKGSAYQYTAYATDNHARRTDTFLATSSPTYTNSTTSTVTVPATYAGRTTTTYDANGRVSEVKSVTNASGTLSTKFDTTYCYNSAAGTACGTGTTTDHSKIQWAKNQLTGQKTAYTYDGSGRVLTATQTGGTSNTIWTYTYDTRGNRLTATATGATTSSQTLTYNAANQITSTGYGYDGAGNLRSTPTEDYTYNGAEQLTSATDTSTDVKTDYKYAGAGQNQLMSESTQGGDAYYFVYGRTDSNSQPEIVLYRTVTDSGDLIGNLFPDPMTGQATMLTTSTDVASLYVYDGLGNPVGLLTDASANAVSSNFDPYGVGTLTGTATAVTQNPYSFHAGTQDRASGLVKFGIRWYNPTTGTWTQEDTLDAPLDPANANRYVFAGGDPINGLDPTGQLTNKQIGCIGGALGVAGGVIGLISGIVFAPTTLGASLTASAGGLALLGGSLEEGASCQNAL